MSNDVYSKIMQFYEFFGEPVGSGLEEIQLASVYFLQNLLENFLTYRFFIKNEFFSYKMIFFSAQLQLTVSRMALFTPNAVHWVSFNFNKKGFRSTIVRGLTLS